MRIVQINCVFDKGSTGRIVSSLHQYYLAHGIESYVIFGRGKTPEDQKTVIRVSSEFGSKARSYISRFTGNLYGMALLPTWQIEETLWRIQPDVVHLHCINGNFCNIFGLVNWLKSHSISTVLTQHAEFFYTGNCGYAFDCECWKTGCHHCPDPQKSIGTRNLFATGRNWQRMRNAFNDFECLQPVGVSDWVSERSDQSVILQEYHCETVLNGLNTNVFCFKGKSEGATREVLYVTPYFEEENKGGKWLLKLADSTNELPIHYTVAGRVDGRYHHNNITFAGSISSPEKLADLYSSADACLLTSKRESFSMVVAEALCCGTPVVGFQAGAPERIGLQEACTFVPYGNLNALKNALIKTLTLDINKASLSEKAREKYAVETMADRYLGIYKRMTKSYHGKN